MNKLLIFAVVVLGALVLLLMTRKGEEGSSALQDEVTSAFQGFLDMDTKAIARIDVVKGEEKVSVAKKGSNWVLESSHGYAADGEKVQKFLDELDKIEGGLQAGWYEKSHPEFEVDKEKGVTVAFSDSGNSELSRVTFGKYAPSQVISESKSFARFGTDKGVFEVVGNPRSLIGGAAELDKDYLLDKTIYELEESREVFEATIVRTDHNVILERRWVSSPKEDPKKDDASADATTDPELEWKEEFYVASGDTSFQAKEKEWGVKSYLNNNKNLRADGAAEPKDLAEYGLDSPQLKVALKHRIKDSSKTEGAPTDEKTLTVLLGNAVKDDEGKDSQYYVMVEGQERVYLVSKWTHDRFAKDLKDFQPDPKEEEKPAEDAPGTPEAGLIEPVSLDGDSPAAPAPAPDAPPASPEPSTSAPSEPEASSTPAAPAPAPTRVAASHILIPYKGASRAPADVSRTEEEAKAEAARILTEIQKDASKFAALAKEHSSCPSSAKGGDLGEFSRGMMAPPFEESAFGMDVGGVSGVVETTFGFHIIQRTK